MSLVKKRSDTGKSRPPMPGSGKPKGVRASDRTRENIRVGVILERLDGAFSGKYELTAVQVAAAKILLDKSLPNLTATDITSGGQSIIIERTQFGAK